MARLAPSQILALWERVSACDPCAQAVALAAAADGLSEESAAALPVGERDRRLYALHAAMFGSGIECVANCPACGELVELGFDTSGLLNVPQQAGPITIESDGYRIACRPPTSRDLAPALRRSDPAQAAAQLMDGLIEEITPGGEAGRWDRLPPALRVQVIEALARTQPAADVELALDCAACGQRWEVAFDIGSYLGAALGIEAARIMETVDLLACRYGWSEADILALPARRRQFYVERAVA